MSNVNSLADHSYIATVKAGECESLLYEMEINVDNLMYDDSAENIQRIKGKLDEIYYDIDERIMLISEIYLGEKNDVVPLRENFEKIKNEHESLLEYVSQENRSVVEIRNYIENNLMSKYGVWGSNIVTIMDSANNRFDSFYNLALSKKIDTVILSVALIIVVLISIFIYQKLLLKQNKLIKYKNDLLDLISKNIDNAFIINNINNQAENFVSDNADKFFGVSSSVILNDLHFVKKHLYDDQGKSVDFDFINSEEDISWNVTANYLRPSDGKEIKMFIDIYYVEISKKEPVYIVVFTDMTENINMREKLQNALTEAERANVAKSEFLSRMSHEIRTPLNGIIGMTFVAIQNIEDKKCELDCLNKIILSSKHLLVLVNDVLDMSKIESGKIEINNEKFNFRVFVDFFTSVFYSQASNKGIDYETVLVGDIPEYLNGDSLRLNQVVNNLVSNAIKFTPKDGKIKVRITLLSDIDKEIMLRFEVMDTGIGIKKENVEKIFNAFEQENTGIGSKYGGTGLGLSISRKFVELMGGNIRVESEENIGSNFIIDIPFSKELSSKPKKYYNYEHLNVLFVDDDIETCEHAKLLLNKIGVNSDYTDNGYDAISMLKTSIAMNKAYDICLIDWKMPYLDGIETTKEIRKIASEKDVVVVLISAYDINEIKDEAVKAGANNVINKPLFESTLIEAFESIKENNKDNTINVEDNSSNVLYDKNILIVEDNEINSEITMELLKAKGANVFQSNDGADAINKFKQSEEGFYDVILMDIQMPNINGYEAAKEIRALHRSDSKKIPIIAITANAFEDDVRLSLNSGMNEHLSKPFDPNEFIKKLKDILI